MSEQEATFESTDKIIESLKEKYSQGGVSNVKDWVNTTFQPKTTITVARDITNLSKVDRRVIYDRAIVQLDNTGNETSVYYLDPVNQDASSLDLFLSLRLTFIETPLEVLVYVE